MIRRAGVTVEPAEQLLTEEFGIFADSSAVVRVGYFPQSDTCIAGSDQSGMAHRDVAVDLSVNQKDRNPGRGHDVLG